MLLSQAAHSVLELFYNPPRDTAVRDLKIICVDGRSGAGKTTLAREVVRQDPRIAVIALESFYRGWDGLMAGPPRLVQQVLRPWVAGLPARARQWNWQEMTWERELVSMPRPRSGLVLIEGCAAGAQIFESFMAGLVWLEAPITERYERAMARDGKVFEPHWEKWAAQEAQYIAREEPRQRADLTLQL